MVDTCAAEFEAQTPYFYSTFDKENEADQPLPTAALNASLYPPLNDAFTFQETLADTDTSIDCFELDRKSVV